MTNSEWDTELAYCIRLVKNRGAIGVPKETIGSYLITMSAQATRDKATNLATSFIAAATLVNMGDYGHAEHTLRLAYLTA